MIYMYVTSYMKNFTIDIITGNIPANIFYWKDVHVFAKEKDVHGKRVYIVATLPQFWYKYTRYDVSIG